MEKKDFLDQFTDDTRTRRSKPSSFKEEEMTRVVKDKKVINPKWIIIPIIGVILLGIAVYFLFLRPNIIMGNFVGLTKTDVSDFVRQEGINADKVVFKEEYSVQFDQDQIISQNVEPGKKISTNEKLTFVVSKGADPDELVSFPTNLSEMTKEQIEEWINTNKLSKTRITTVYDPLIPEGKVISYDLKNTDPKDFKRGSILQIKVSKGPQPPGQVTVEDFKGKDYGTAETWAKTKKINIKKVEEFSDTLAAGLIISQSSPSGSTIQEESDFTVVVSKGKGVIIPDFSTMTRDQVDKWLTENAAVCIVKEKYSSKDGYIVEQSVKSGTKIGADEKVELVKTLGKWYLYSTEFGESPIGQTVEHMADICNNLRSKGIDAYFGEWGSTGERQWSDTYKAGQIVKVSVANSSGTKTYSLEEHLPLDTRFTVTTSRGLRIVVSDTDLGGKDSKGNYTTSTALDYLISKGIPYTLDSSFESGSEKCTLDGWTVEDGKNVWYEGETGSIKVKAAIPE